MVKTRKTLKQKKQADLHTNQRLFSDQPSSEFTYTFTTPPKGTPSKTLVTVPDIKHDLTKTLGLTSIIVIAELVLFFVL